MLLILHLTCVFGICVLDIFSGFSGWWVELFTVAFRRVQRVYVDQAITTGATATNFFGSNILMIFVDFEIYENLSDYGYISGNKLQTCTDYME